MWAVAYGRRLRPPNEGDGVLAHPEVSSACGCLAWHPHWALWGDGKLLVLDGYRYVAARVANWQNGGVWDGQKYSAELAVERGLATAGSTSGDGSDTFLEKQREESPLVPAALLSPASGSPSNKKKKKKKRRKSESAAGKKRSPKPRPSVPAITNDDGGLE
eukprot:COSAG01_NODE_497_length_16267_cov_5.357558_19_plen_161_part_00